ncbi:hypothetical protein ID866_10880 [Astraeus odoratus]|nr:hypothetical protein ID866_10880 [Astraeus odoratus]
MGIRGLLGHLDGTSVKPAHPNMKAGREDSWVPVTDPEQAELEDYKADLKKWETSDNGTKSCIAVSLPDSMFLHVMHLDTAAEMVKHLTKMFQQCSHIVTAQLQHQLCSMQCPEHGNICEHFDKMCLLREQLASMNHPLLDDVFIPIITTSLPPLYDTQISSIMTLAMLSGTTLTPEAVMASLEDEYDRHAMKGKKSVNHGEDTAYSAGVSCSGKKPFKGKCYKCEGYGHRASECPTPDDQSKTKNSKKGKRKKGKGNEGGRNNQDKDKQSFTEKAATANDDSDSDHEPDGVSFVSMEDGWEEQSDWLSDDKEEDMPCLCAAEADEEEAKTTTLSYAFLATPSTSAKNTCTELYDSGATCHMSSYRDHFINFCSIPPKPITAANKHTFEAIGKCICTSASPTERHIIASS